MGKGTKHKAEWKLTKFQVVIDAIRLYNHTVKIMSNPKVFNPENDYCGATLNLIHQSVLVIYLDVWTANHINAVEAGNH